VSDELDRKAPVSDEGEGQDEDVEAHKKHAGATDDGGDDVEAHRHHLGADDEGDDDVEAHRHHLGRQHGGA